MDNKIKKAFELGKLVKLRQHLDALFTETADKKKATIEKMMRDIIEEYPELEELIPNPICYN